MAMRIIAGTARGRTVLTPSTKLFVKPISGRMRQSLFDILRPRVTGSHFLDLYAGSGAVGLEALSRGAQRAVFVEKDPRCVAVIEKNLQRLGWAERGTALRGDARGRLSWVAARTGLECFDLIFLGPPYRDEENRPLALTRPTLEAVLQDRVLAPEGWLIAQHHKKEPTAPPPGLRDFRHEPYGDTVISFYQLG